MAVVKAIRHRTAEISADLLANDLAGMGFIRIIIVQNALLLGPMVTSPLLLSRFNRNLQGTVPFMYMVSLYG